MTVVLTLSSSEEWIALVERSTISSVDNINELDKVDSSVLVKNSVSIEEVHNTLSLYDSVILVYPAIQTILSEELRAGTNCELAIRTAINHVDEILTAHRPARNKLKMLSMRSLNFATSEELTLLSEMGWSLDSNSVEINDDIFTLAAYQIVHQNKQLKKLADLLAASSIPLGKISDEVKVDAVLECYSLKLDDSEKYLKISEKNKNELRETQRELNSVEEMLSSGEAARELLLLQATQLQEELKKYFNCSSELENEKISAAKRERELLDNERVLTELNGLQVKKIAEQGLLLNEKNRVLEQLECQINEELTKLERTCDELNIARMFANDIEDSLAVANSRVSELNTEVEMLKAHLSVVQSELETFFIKSTELEDQRCKAQKEISLLEIQSESTKRKNITLEKKLKELEEARRIQNSEHIRETKQLQRECSKLERKFKQQRGELATRIHQVERLTSELESIKASGSWKIGAPVRAVGRVLEKVDRKKHKLQQDKGLLYTSGLFDADWYLSTYSDVKDANIDPVEHYLEYGAKEGRLPSASFDGNWYLKRYPDVADSDVNPLVHYLKFGQNEGRSASPALLENLKD